MEGAVAFRLAVCEFPDEPDAAKSASDQLNTDTPFVGIEIDLAAAARAEHT